MSWSRLIALVLVLATLAIYLPVSHHGFSIYDDPAYVTDNAVVQNGLSWSGIQWAFTTWHAANWHPLTWVSHMLDCQLFGLNAGPQHVVSLLFHTANVILLFVLLMRLTGQTWPAAFAAALFAWHPLHVESVAWISERKDVLSTFFALWTLLCYTRFVQKPESQNRSSSAQGLRLPPAGVRMHNAVFYWLAVFFFALALMSKPMFVTLPFVLLLLDFWPLQRLNASTVQCLLLEKVPFFALSIASCVVTFFSQRHGGAVMSLATIPLELRAENVPVAYALYLLKLFWPAHLAVFYPLPATILPVAIAAATAILVFISAAAWVARKKFPYVSVGWFWFLGTLIPVIGLVKVGAAAMADRYAYFPSIGIFLALALGLQDAAKRFHLQKMIIAGAVVVLVACLALTGRQLNFWRDDIALFSHDLAVTADNNTARLNLGIALEKSGQTAQAMAAYRQALQLEPQSIEAHVNLANLLDETGRTNEALAEFQTALQLDPDSTAALDNFGTLLVQLGQIDRAEGLYRQAAQLDPMDWQPPFLMGKALLKQGRDAEAVPFLGHAQQLAPDNAHVLNFFGQVLASDTDASVRNGRSALALATRANDLTGGIQPDVLDTLAMAYAETGQFAQAQQTAEDATNVATALDLTNNAAEIGLRLQLYQNNQPFRQSFTNAPARESPKE